MFSKLKESKHSSSVYKKQQNAKQSIATLDWNYEMLIPYNIYHLLHRILDILVLNNRYYIIMS